MTAPNLWSQCINSRHVWTSISTSQRGETLMRFGSLAPAACYTQNHWVFCFLYYCCQSSDAYTFNSFLCSVKAGSVLKGRRLQPSSDAVWTKISAHFNSTQEVFTCICLLNKHHITSKCMYDIPLGGSMLCMTKTNIGTLHPTPHKQSALIKAYRTQVIVKRPPSALALVYLLSNQVNLSRIRFFFKLCTNRQR